jgi:hypothetical protein
MTQLAKDFAAQIKRNRISLYQSGKEINSINFIINCEIHLVESVLGNLDKYEFEKLCGENLA